MAQFIEKKVTKDSKWDVLGRSGNSVGEIKYHDGSSTEAFCYFPNSEALRTGLYPSTVEQISEFLNEKNEELLGN